MSSYKHGKTEVIQAMTMDLSQSTRVWDIPDLHIKVDNLPEKATVQKTFVMMTLNGNWHAGLKWTVEGETGEYMKVLLSCSSLQELLDKMPEHFEVDGNVLDLC